MRPSHKTTTVRKRLPTPLLLPLALVAVLLTPPQLYSNDSITESPITDDDRDHWSFKPIVRPAVPVTSLDDWAKTPIDHFILRKLELKQLQTQSEASRVTLIRRLYFDIIGLPPSPGEVDSFVADQSPNAYERLVDRLLASHHYGEHWAQHWLDLARFAETDGFEHDKVRSDAWKYRDWLIDALNADMPYDRFISLQLAADEIAPNAKQHQIATAFCLSGPDMPDINSQEERRHNVLNELAATVGGSLLALQVGCAQCHDHKYDPVSQADFYRLRAIFEPAVSVKKNKSLSVLNETADTVPVSHLMIRGDWQRVGPEVSPGLPRIANLTGNKFAPEPSHQTTGRRAALAKWLIDSKNPLTARVIANRVWQFHFGNGLSQTPSDFGIVGDEPTHPELLDWLATELVRQDWSLKQLHRLIVTSATYRQASISENDSSTLWLSRFPRRRLSGEAIRDAMLAVSGTLNNAVQGPGVMPPLPDELVKTLLKNQWKTSDNEADHYRRSIYIFARRNLRYPIFDAFDRPDANASCPQRGKSTTAPQSLLLLNSAFSLNAARRLAGSLLTEHDEVDHTAITSVFRRTLCRQPSEHDLTELTRFMQLQTEYLRDKSQTAEQLALPLPCPASIDPYEAAALTDLCLALLNCNEFIYID